MKDWEVEMERIFVCLVHLVFGFVWSNLVWSLVFLWPVLVGLVTSIPALVLIFLLWWVTLPLFFDTTYWFT